MKTFVISMDTPNGRTRLAKLSQECAREGIDDIEHIVGVDAKTISQEVLESDVGKMCQSFCSPGMIGCGISHMRCWRAIVERNLPCALILEDDASLLPNFRNKMFSVLREVPQEYHVLLLGCFHCDKGDSPVTDHVRKIDSFAGTHAYVVSQHGARFLVDNIPQVNYHIDMQLARIPGIKMYASKTNLAIQNGDGTSSNADIGFPGSLNRVFMSIRDQDNMSLAHYMNTGFLRLGTLQHHIIITKLAGLFVLAGVIGVPWKLMALFAAIDIAMFPPSSVMDPTVKMSMYALGLGIKKLLHI
jgi:glycosyl transferase family 25